MSDTQVIVDHERRLMMLEAEVRQLIEELRQNGTLPNANDTKN